jgi:hypothetical protein
VLSDADAAAGAVCRRDQMTREVDGGGTASEWTPAREQTIGQHREAARKGDRTGNEAVARKMRREPGSVSKHFGTSAELLLALRSAPAAV